MSVTIKDIAERAGVSFSTVSKALNDSPLVHMDTKQRILDISLELGYQPNTAARRLVSNKSWTIGVVWPSVERFAPSALITRINNEMAKHNYTTLLSINQTELAIETFLRLQCDAILVFYDREGEELQNFTKQSVIPILYYGVNGLTPFTTIDATRSKAIELAIEHLVSLGHERIAYVGNTNSKDPLQSEKVAAFTEQLAKYHLPITIESLIPVNSLDTYDGYMITKQLLVSSNQPTAIISGSYDLTKGILRAATELQIQVPEQLSIISYDNIQQMEELEVPMTAVGVSLEEIVSTTVRTLLTMIEQKDPVPSIYLVPELVIRSSTSIPARI
ncbi:LacI family DNA-binding transcriptional regulator [Paenibacillus sp. FA6]|uniref:LacI family DNA-binding transcriptional regulator n=1 Tax=Paenibacillus sp. FA6 TaxID=3413029 RepID=UPI003F65647B